MHLKILKADTWSELGIILQDKHQKDYDYFVNGDIEVFVYGYPYHEARATWLSASDLHQSYLKKGTNFVDDIEGVFTVIILDKTKRKCFVIVDRYGVYNLFYLRNHHYIILSDVISEITAHMSAVRLNRGSIIEYLNFAFKLGNKTHIEDIYEFESARIYEINKELEITERVYWEFRGRLEEDKMTKQEFLAVFNAHIATAMSLSEKVCLPLTGGLDTRMLLSACISEKERLHCYTHGVKNTSDVKLAQTICNHFKIRHSFYELNEEWIRTIPALVVKHAEIFNGLIPSIINMHVKESYAKESGEGELIISGNLGNELWRCILGRKVVNSASIDDVSTIIAKRAIAMNPNLNDIYYDYSNKEIINLLTKSVKTELLRYKNAEDPVALAESFTFAHYCSNWASNSFKAMGKHFKVFVALLQKDLLQQIPLQSLAEKTSGSIEKHIITKNNSYLASLPLDTGRTITNNLSVKFKGYIRLLPLRSRLATNKISQRMFKADVFRTPYFTDYSGWLRSRHKEFVLEVLSYERMITKELFKERELEKAVNSFLNGDNYLTRFIVGLMSLELWLRRVLAK